MRFRFAVAFAFAFALAIAAAAQEAPGLPFSPSSGGGVTASSLTGIFCKITGGVDCQLTSSFRAPVTSPLPSYTFHGNDGWGTATLFGMGKTGPSLTFYANSSANPVASFSSSGSMILASAQGANPRFLECYDGGVSDYCQFLTTSTSTGDYLDVDGQIRVNGGTAAIPAVSFDGDTDTGMLSAAANTIAWSTGGASEMTLSATALTPAAAGGNALGTSALPWAGLVTSDGSVSAPAVSFGADTNTGLYRVGTDALGFATGGGLALQLGGGTAGQEQRVIAANDTTGSGGLARGYLHLPRSVGAAVVSAPGCSAGTEGAMWFVDDVDDSKPGLLCLCTRRSDNTTVEWLNVSLTAGAAAIGTGCAP